MKLFKNGIIYLFVITFVFACTHGSKNSSSTDESISEINLKVKKVTLDNGLRLLIYENHKLPIFTYYTFYDVGGRYESREEGTTGASHFLEHLMFKGAKKYGPRQFDSIIEGNGGYNNAYTTFDSTVYYEGLSSSMVEKVADMESDRMMNLLLEPKGFESERLVVMEERKYRYENSPRGKLYLNMMKEVFKGTPYGGSVIGDVKDLKSITRDKVKDYFEKYYAPNNAIIVITGDVDSDDVIDIIKEKYGHLKYSKAVDEIKKKRDHPKLYEHKAKYKREYKIHGESKSPMFMMAFKGDPIGTRKSFVQDILSSVLGDGSSSYLNQRFVKNKYPQLTNISASNYTLKHSGVFYISGELLKGSSLKKFKASLNKELKRICDKSITPRSLQKTKNQYLLGYYTGIQDNSGVASFLGMRESFYSDYNYYKKEIQIYNSITVNELKQICHETFDKEESIFLSLWDKHKK
jgi:zinc protease